MTLAEYAAHDACGLAALVKAGQITPKELADAAARACQAVNPRVNAVVELYPDRIDGLDEATLKDGPFRGVPLLIKDFYGHEAGRRIEFGSRLCRGVVAQQNTYLFEMLRDSGVNVVGRSAAPEYSMSGTTEGALYGNTSTPWRIGFSAGGSTGGGMAAVAAGIVPIAHGSDIAGSIRVPASFCGGVGLKPSRGRVSLGPAMDENGFGLGQNFVQTKSVRDTATMLDCLSVPQVGDPFAIPRPAGSYAAEAAREPKRLRIGWSTAPVMGIDTDREVADAVRGTALLLEEMGHDVVESTPAFDGTAAMEAMTAIWFFGFDTRLEGYAARGGRAIGPDTVEPVVLAVYEHAKRMKPVHLVNAISTLNAVRRQIATVFAGCDVWITPTTPRVAEPWGTYNLGRTDVTIDNLIATIYRGVCQYTLPHNIMGTPAISLPLAMHSTGLPIGIQLGAPHAQEHVVLKLANALEIARPWRDRVPPVHASRA